MSNKEATAVAKRFSIHLLFKNKRSLQTYQRGIFTKWNSFSGVEAAQQGFLDEPTRKGSVRRSKETQKITAKMGHCPEVDGNRFLIHRVVFPAAPRLHSIQPELVVSIRVAAHKFRFVRNRIGAVQSRRLDRPHKNDGAFRQHPR